MSNPTPTPASPELLLRPGIDITTWAELKYAHAVTRINELNSRVAEWQVAVNVTARAETIDESSFQWVLDVHTPPPTDEWSLILGDAIHNFRSIFDTITWAFANIEGKPIAKPRDVQFPIVETQKKWDDAMKKMPTIPADLVARLLLTQSFAAGIEHDDAQLTILHRLDIQDKHKGIIAGTIAVDQLQADNIRLFAEEEAGKEYQMQYAIADRPILATPGAWLGTWTRLDGPLRTPSPDYRAKARMTFRIIDPDDDKLGAFIGPFASDLSLYVREVLDMLYGGIAWQQTRTAARNAPPGITMSDMTEEGVLVRTVEIPGLPSPTVPAPAPAERAPAATE